MSVKLVRVGALCLALAIAVTSQSAAACSRVPPGQALRMTPEQIDASARNMLAGASAMVEGTVVRIPTFAADRVAGLGLLRVDRVIFGQAPATVAIGRTMCSGFDSVGERGILLVRSDRPALHWLHPQLVEALTRIAAAGER